MESNQLEIQEARKKVNDAVRLDNLGPIVKITGKWLIKNDLVEVYKKLRKLINRN